jgi:hypothetical protein
MFVKYDAWIRVAHARIDSAWENTQQAWGLEEFADEEVSDMNMVDIGRSFA